MYEGGPGEGMYWYFSNEQWEKISAEMKELTIFEKIKAFLMWLFGAGIGNGFGIIVAVALIVIAASCELMIAGIGAMMFVVMSIAGGLAHLSFGEPFRKFLEDFEKEPEGWILSWRTPFAFMAKNYWFKNNYEEMKYLVWLNKVEIAQKKIEKGQSNS